MTTLRLVTEVTGANPNLHDLYLDASSQLEWIGDGDPGTEDYARDLAQRIKTRLLLVGGEWYLDIRQGTPWRERIWLKGATVEQAKAVLRRVVLSTPGVADVLSIEASLDPATRTLSVTGWQVVTDDRKMISSEDLDEPFIVEVSNG
jgi:hypothetical protein